jgi:hypothetical protein
MTTRACNVCGAALKERFPHVSDPETHEDFAIYCCGACGLGHTLPQPDDIGHYYGEAYHGGRHGFTAIYRARRRLNVVNSAFSNGKEKSMLDVGCGDGTFLLAAQNDGWTICGTEMNPGIARSSGLDVRETIDQLPRGAMFDCITLWHSLEHLRDPRATIVQLAGMLEIDGAIVIAVPDAGGLQARVFGPNWFHLDVPRHLYHFTAGSLGNLIQSVGLAVERQSYMELEYDLLGWSQSALNLLMPIPNGFFRAITGRARQVGKVTHGLTLGLGAVLTAVALPAVAAGTLVHRGGTLVIVARRK